MQTNYNYYKSQLDRVNPNASVYPSTIKVFTGDKSTGEDTKHLSLNEESAKALIQWLSENFIENTQPNNHANR